MKKFLTAIVGSSILAGSMLMGASSASAVVHIGPDPLAAGCASDAYTASSWLAYDADGAYQARVELRYSPKCGTNWVRVTQERASYNMNAAIYLDNDNKNYGRGYGDGYASWWTGMVYAPGSACVTIYVSGNNGQTQTLVWSPKRICG